MTELPDRGAQCTVRLCEVDKGMRLNEVNKIYGIPRVYYKKRLVVFISIASEVLLLILI